jgi:hypothetical protein
VRNRVTLLRGYASRAEASSVRRAVVIPRGNEHSEDDYDNEGSKRGAQRRRPSDQRREGSALWRDGSAKDE